MGNDNWPSILLNILGTLVFIALSSDAVEKLSVLHGKEYVYSASGLLDS